MATVRLPDPGPEYDLQGERRRNEVIERELEDRRMKVEDFEANPARIILTSPSGLRYVLTVDDAGVLGTTPL